MSCQPRGIECLKDAVLQVAKKCEEKLDAEIERVSSESYETLRRERLEQLKKENAQKKEWVANGHGDYTEVEEKEFFEMAKKSSQLIVHFFTLESSTCKIFDSHLKKLAQKHLEARFLRIRADRSPFLVDNFKIRVLPALVLIKDNTVRDQVRGFSELGNRFDFSTDMLEWRIAVSGVIDYDGDLTSPPDAKKGKPKFLKQRTNHNNIPTHYPPCMGTW